MSTKLKLQDIIKEAGDGGGAVHASGVDLASLVTGNGALGLNKLIDRVKFGKNKPTKRRGTDVSNSKDGGVSHAIAQAMFTADLAEKGLSNMGVNVSDLGDQDTIDYYKALKIFPLVFSINKPIKNFFDDESNNIKGQASVDQRSNAKKFIIYFTHKGESGEVVYRFNFLAETLKKNLKGTRFDLPMLIKNEKYDVRISIKNDSSGNGWDDPGTQDEPPKDEPPKDEPPQDGPPQDDPPNDGGTPDPNNPNPPVPSEIKKNRNEIFRLLLKNYGGYNGKVVYGDGFYKKEEAAEYQKLLRGKKKGDVESSEVESFRKSSSRDKFSMMIANLRKSFPTTFLKKLDKAFPEFNLSYQKSVEESVSLLREEENDDKYKRWSIVFGNSIGNKTIDELDKNIRGFMSAVKIWFASPIVYRGKTQSYKINFDGDSVNNYWQKFYGKEKNESHLSIGNLLEDILSERRPPKQKKAPPKGTRVGQGERWDDKEKLPKYYDRILKINDIPTFKNDPKTMDRDEKNDDDAILTGKLEITDGGGNSTWSISGAENQVNKELKKGVIIKPSKKFKDKALIIEWRTHFDLGGVKTKAMLVSPLSMNVSEFLNRLVGTGVTDLEIEIGRKVGGDESIDKPAKGKISLKLKQ